MNTNTLVLWILLFFLGLSCTSLEKSNKLPPSTADKTKTLPAESQTVLVNIEKTSDSKISSPTVVEKSKANFTVTKNKEQVPENTYNPTITPQITAVDQKPEINTVLQKTPIPVDTAIKLFWESQELTLQDLDLNVYAKAHLDFQFPPSLYWYIFDRQGELVSPLDQYWLTPQEPSRKTRISLESFTEDIDWFFIATSSRISLHDQQKLQDTLMTHSDLLTQNVRGIKPSQLSTQVQSKACVTWNLYTIDANASNARLLGTIHIYHTPFSLMVRVKKKGEQTFQKFTPDIHTIQEDDAMQITIKTYESVYLSIFLRDAQAKIVQLYPREGVQEASKIEKGLTFDLFSSQGAVVDATEGKEYLVSFYGTAPLDCTEIQKWLETTNHVDLEQKSKFQQRGYVGIAQEEEESQLSEEIKSEKEKIKAPSGEVYVISLDHTK